MTKVGFTGTSVGMTVGQKIFVKKLLESIGPTEVHHGDCVGADFEFDKIAENMRIPRVIHPPLNPKLQAFCDGETVLEKKPYLDRDRDIVDVSDVIIATPKEDNPVVRSGTWYTIRYARKQNKVTHIIYPGRITKEEFI